ncbi:DNA primase, partial [gut metagenome]
GALAIKKGFNVTVRELPFGVRELTAEELLDKYDGIVPKDANREVLVKNDADSYIQSMDIYLSLKEKYFLVWMAEKLFAQTADLAEEGQCVSRIAELLRYVKDQMVYDQCIGQLGKIYGKTRLWRNAVEQIRNNAKKTRTTGMDKKQEETDALRQVGLFVSNNCYFCLGKEDDDPIRLSNFVMEPLFHIHDESNGVRLFRLTNSFRETCIV